MLVREIALTENFGELHGTEYSIKKGVPGGTPENLTIRTRGGK